MLQLTRTKACWFCTVNSAVPRRCNRDRNGPSRSSCASTPRSRLPVPNISRPPPLPSRRHSGTPCVGARRPTSHPPRAGSGANRPVLPGQTSHCTIDTGSISSQVRSSFYGIYFSSTQIVKEPGPEKHYTIQFCSILPSALLSVISHPSTCSRVGAVAVIASGRAGAASAARGRRGARNRAGTVPTRTDHERWRRCTGQERREGEEGQGPRRGRGDPLLLSLPD